ncbi:MAG: acylneuraminate cytidylyltransferase family protein, partial [SAR324 cluster bacterium]|nr:acylneuraminate cytidylyltransferase family protein [SAR324 cluster bacterium]
MTSVVALVPMRHNSERVPQKNYRLFNGKPLFVWIVEELTKCQSVSDVYINTDSPVVKEHASKISSKVKIIDRPESLRSGHTPMNDILLYDAKYIGATYYLQTHSTNPLLKAHTIEKGIQTFFSSLTSGYDSLFGVTGMQTRFWTRDGKPVNHDPSRLERTQDLPPLYEENSNIYIFSGKILEERRNRIGAKPVLF